MNKNAAAWSTAVATLLLSGVLLAQTRYVSDQLEITLRTGPSTQNAIVRILPSGTALEVLGEDADAGYTQVRTSGGSEGWVLTRFLTSQPVARDRLAVAERERAEALEQADAARQALASVRSQLTETQARLQESEQTNETLLSELNDVRAASAGALRLRQEHKAVQARNVDLEQQLQTLTTDNRELRSRASREWFVLGAGVVIVGILLGLLLPRLRVKRRSSWGDL